MLYFITIKEDIGINVILKHLKMQSSETRQLGGVYTRYFTLGVTQKPWRLFARGIGFDIGDLS